MNNIDFDSTELCLIDSGIKSLQKIPLRPQIQVLNLHSNFIHRIENLFHLRNLKHLDLSANQISKIEGIENLTYLRTINLSCNHLSDVRGLNGLRYEVKLFLIIIMRRNAFDLLFVRECSQCFVMHVI